MPSEQPTEEFKYWGFISYSHADAKTADWLHKGIETYNVPKRLVGKPTREGIVPKRAFPVFRDRDELPGSANLGDNLTRALKQSRYLIVICSPKAAASQWVDQEVRIFKSLGREDRVLCLIVDGEPNAAAHPELGLQECFPEAVRFWVDSDRRITEIPTEPIAADARKGKDGRHNALLKVMAGILGVSFDDLKQRDQERRERQRNIQIGVLASLVGVFAFLGVQLNQQKNKAVAAEAQVKSERDKAISEKIRADRAALVAIDSEAKAKISEAKAKESESKAVAALDGEKMARAEAETAKNDAIKARDAAKTSEKKAVDALDGERQAKLVAEAARVEAEKQKAEAEVQRGIAEEKKKEISRALAASDFSEATRLIGEGSEAKAIASLARALRYDSGNTAVSARLLSLLSQRNWSLPKLEPLKFNAEVRIAQFSPDGQKLLGVSGSVARLSDPANGKEIAQFRHNSPITSAQFSPDGKYLATASQDNLARVWEAATGRKISEVKHNDYVLSVRFSKDGKSIVSTTRDKMARVWDAATGKIIAELPHEGRVAFASFSSDGKYIVTAAGSSGRIWDIETSKLVGMPLDHAGGVESAMFSPNGKLVATASGDHTARLWDPITSMPVGEPLKHDDFVFLAQFSGDGRFLVTASRDKTARVWDVTTGKAVGTPLKHDNVVNYAEFSPNTKWVLTLSDDGTARVWDSATGNPVTEALKHTSAIKGGGFSSDGQYVVTGSDDKTMRVWEIATGKPIINTFKHDGYPVTAVAFSDDDRLVATGSEDRTARVWEAATGKSLFDFPIKVDSRVTSVALSHDSKYLLTASEDRMARLWDLSSGKLAFEPFKHESTINAAVFSPDGKYVLTASDDRTAKLWETATGKQWQGDMRHEGIVKSACFSPTGDRVVTASSDKNARVWSVATAKQVGPNMAHKDGLLSAQFSKDGKLVATSSEDKTARVWNAESGQPVCEPLPHDANVSWVKFNSMYPWVLTVSDRTIRIWDIKTGSLVTEPLKLDEPVKYASFSPDGQLLLTVADKYARLWDAASCAPVAEPFRHDGPIRAATFNKDGRMLVTGSGDYTARTWLVTLPGTVPNWLVDLAEAASGYHQGDAGAAQLVSEPWKKYAAAKTGLNASANDAFAAWGRWYSADRLARPVSPLSKVGTAEYIRRRVDEGTPAALNEVLELQPNNGLALAKLAKAAKEIDQAEFFSALAEKYEPKNPDVLWYRAQILQQESKQAEAFEVLTRAIALDSRNINVFGPAGTEVTSINKENNISKGWLPNGWSDFNAALPIGVTYEKLNDPPPNLTAIRINASSSSRGMAQIKGPRFVAKHGGKYVVEGWVRSANKTDLVVSVRQIVEPFQKYQEQVQKTGAEWSRFQIRLNPTQDYGAELVLSQSGGPLDIAGVVVRGE